MFENDPLLKGQGAEFVASPHIEGVNVGSRGESETERVLSNFADTSFELDGRTYQTVESFWQGLYFPEGSVQRDEIAVMAGSVAKRAGRTRPEVLTHITYRGKMIEIGSLEHHELMRKALKAKFEQNPHALAHLLSTRGKTITHILTKPDGTPLPDSKSIPGVIFSQMLMDLREELSFGDTRTVA